MEAWQYSALNAQFATLQRQLLSTIPPFKSDRHLHRNGYFDEPMGQVPGYDDVVKSGVKRKSEDILELQGVKYQRVDSLMTCDTSSLLMLDMYTQTEPSFLREQNKQTSQIFDLVRANHERLERLEQLLGRLVEAEKPNSEPTEVQVTRGRRKPSKLDIKRVLPADSAEHLQVLEFPLYSQPQSHKSDADSEHLSPSVDSTRSPPVISPVLSHGSHVSFSEPAVHVSSVNDWANTGTQALDSARLDPQARDLGSDPSVLVPVIIAPSNKGRLSVTTEVPLHDILTGAAPNIEDVDQSSYARGSWLGDKSDPGSRVWYCGDPKVIQRAESSGTNPAKLSLNLLEALFIREEMAASNVNGARGRELLSPIKINAIQSHINFKFPLESTRQIRRWQYIKPRIDSKCRAKRRLQREQQARQDNTSMMSPRSFNTRMCVDQHEKELLLYGFLKSDVDDVIAESIPGSERLRHVNKQS